MTLSTELAAAGLTGRGGAAFATATKLDAAAANRADLIVNACDGELGAVKDAWVVANQLPDLIRGARLIAPHTSAIYFAAHRNSVTHTQLAAAGVAVLPVPARYVSSEETSLISLAQGGLARPMTKRRPFVFGGTDTTGRKIRPMVVLNAETVWRAAQIADHGAAWFRSFGTQDQPGPRLVSITGPSAAPVVLDTQAGVPLRDLIGAAGIDLAAAGAALIGGLGGAFVPSTSLEWLRWADADLASLGATMGPGVIAVRDRATCPLAEVGRLLAYAVGESAGQCGPCMFGLPALAAAWRRFLDRPDAAAAQEISARAGLLPGRGACHFPDGVAKLVGSALRVFADDLAAHQDGTCIQERTSARVTR